MRCSWALARAGHWPAQGIGRVPYFPENRYTLQTVSKDLQEALQAVEAARMSDYIELRVSEISRQSRGYPLTLDKESLERYSVGVKKLNETEKQALTLTRTDISNKQKERMTNYFIARLL
jgi:CHASE3 domain sensor protein